MSLMDQYTTQYNKVQWVILEAQSTTDWLVYSVGPQINQLGLYL